MTQRLALRAALIFFGGLVIMAISAATVTLVMRPDLLRGPGTGERVVIGGPFQLVDTTGAKVNETIFEDTPYALFFGFTYCPDICPTTLAEASLWIEELGDDAEKMKFAFVSVDPERDTPDVLGDYVGAFNERIIGLTGTPEQIEAMTKSYRVYARRVELDDGDYTMDHSAAVLLFNSNGDLTTTITYQNSQEEALEKLRRLL